MKPDNEARRVLSALLRDAGEGMSDAELDALIGHEMEKGEEMDADLVAEALRDQAEQESPEEAASRRTANWTAITQKLDQRKGAGKSPFGRRRAWWAHAAAAVLIVLGLISLGAVASYAFRWDSLVKVFRPFVEETLGIHMNVEDLESAGEIVKQESAEPPAIEQELISETTREVSKVPKTVHGFAAVPTWLPEGYTFNYAELFDDHNEASLLIAYRKNDVELFVQTIVYSEKAITAINVVEKEAQIGRQNAKAVDIVENNGIVSATCEDNLTYYMVWGRLSRDDISAVITSIR